MSKSRSSLRPRQTGLSLIELMVALVIGLFLIIGAVSVYQQARNAYRTTEAVARVQETARYAFDILEPEIRMASYWGFNSRPDYVEGRAAPGAGVPAELAAYAAKLPTCGDNFAINLDEYLSGRNGTGAAGGYNLTCAAYQNAPKVGADVLIVRRAAEQNSDSIEADRLYLQTSRLRGTLFVPAADCADVVSCTEIPAGYAPPQSRTHELDVSAYYVALNSTDRAGFPSLRRKRLTAMTAANIFQDEEVIPGVEDMQVRFGVDTNGDTNADQYVDANNIPGGSAVVSATVWLRVRAEEPDFTFQDTDSYQYADMAAAWTPNDAESRFRRLVVSKTIQLRNSRR